jgi:3-dehydroquinate synthase
MNTVKVNLEGNKSYIIDINNDLSNFNLIDKINKNCKIVIVTDTNVDFYYGDLMVNKIKSFGFDVNKYVVKPGEESKSIETLYSLCKYLNEWKITRNDYLIAFGGGVVGDLTGLCASIYLRGINFIQIPTTLLAMVDSSVGGKTAINMKCGKNLIGTFYQPKYVYCCLDFLKTLDKDIYRDGCAEIIKYAFIYDKQLYNIIKDNNFDELTVITRCIEIKADIVSKDEYDNNIRAILNFGHTLGHTFEILSNFNISHGEAVAKGMLIATKISKYLGLSNLVEDVENILNIYGFDITVNYSIEEIYNIMLSDKKRKNKVISFILLNEIGKCNIKEIEINSIKDILSKSL